MRMLRFEAGIAYGGEGGGGDGGGGDGGGGDGREEVTQIIKLSVVDFRIGVFGFVLKV